MTRHRSLQCKLLLSVIALLGSQRHAMASSNEGVSILESSMAQSIGQSAATSTPVGAHDGLSPVQAPGVNIVSQQAAPVAQAPQAPTPIGTAAAPDTHVDGIAASTPSGAAIAPAKQKRVRRFAIRTALVVGAVVAVGIVSAVSFASPGRP